MFVFASISILFIPNVVFVPFAEPIIHPVSSEERPIWLFTTEVVSTNVPELSLAKKTSDRFLFSDIKPSKRVTWLEIVANVTYVKSFSRTRSPIISVFAKFPATNKPTADRPLASMFSTCRTPPSFESKEPPVPSNMLQFIICIIMASFPRASGTISTTNWLAKF